MKTIGAPYDTYIVEYHHNNSGGYDWLNENDWNRLEEAGWEQFGYKSAAILVVAPNERAAEAEAIEYWEATLGPSFNHSDRGCDCCGRPHSFYVTTPKEHYE